MALVGSILALAVAVVPVAAALAVAVAVLVAVAPLFDFLAFLYMFLRVSSSMIF